MAEESNSTLKRLKWREGQREGVETEQELEQELEQEVELEQLLWELREAHVDKESRKHF